jgi:RNA polymerase-binding transcription factor DksA
VAQIETTLDDVDRALERLRAGTYRTCRTCQASIDDADLQSNPLLEDCSAHPALS